MNKKKLLKEIYKKKNVIKPNQVYFCSFMCEHNLQTHNTCQSEKKEAIINAPAPAFHFKENTIFFHSFIPSIFA
jgi:hypothetical protein